VTLRRPRTFRLVVMVMVAVTALLPMHSASASATPAATVSPEKELVDGQTVNVAWSGFLPDEAVYIRLCARGATSDAKCALPAANPESSFSTPDGTGNIRFRLAAASFGPFSCDESHACDVALLQDPADLGSGVKVPIAFARAPAPCPASTVPPVAGEGASPAAYTSYKWQNAACKLPSHVNVTYTNDNSYDGMTNWVNQNPNADFAVSGVSLPADQAADLSAKHRAFGYAPLTATAVAVAFNIVDRAGHQINHLVLSPKIVAEIATGSISTFACPPGSSDEDCATIYGGDPEIRRLNPGVDFPTGSVHFNIRAEHSASNLAFTSWLSATAPDIWTYGPSPVWPPPFPHQCASCAGGVQGEANTADSVGFPLFYTAQDVYLGVIDSTYAAVKALPVAQLVNPGQPDTGVGPSAASVASALHEAAVNADGTITPKYDTSNPASYPMPLLTYAMVPTSKGWPNFLASDGKNLSAFLRYAVGDGQKILVDGSYPLTHELKAQTRTVAGEIPLTGPPAGGGHHHHPDGGGTGGGSSGGGGGGSGFGSGGDGSGFGSGSGSGAGAGGGSSQVPAARKGRKASTPKPVQTAFTAVGSRLSSPGTMVPASLGFAILAGLMVPLVRRLRGQTAAVFSPRLPGFLRRGRAE
jgi:ABC-type phosphate transport system substrate-binding protein